MKKREDNYYVLLANRILDNGGICTKDQLKDLIWKTDEELGFKKTTTPRVIIDKLSRLFGEFLEEAETERENRGVGLRRKTTLYSLSVNKDEVEQLITSKAAKEETRITSLTESGKKMRDVTVRLARNIEEANPEIQRKVSIKIAKCRIPKAETVKKFMILLKKAENTLGNTVESSWIREQFGKFCSKSSIQGWIKSLENGGVKLSINFVDSNIDGRGWAMVIKDIDATRISLNTLAEAVGIKPSAPKKIESKQQVVPTIVEKPENNYLIFAIAGIVYENGSTMSSVSIGSILRNNSYKSLNVSDYDILGIVRNHPELFDISLCSRKHVGLVGTKEEVKKILRKINPANQSWDIPWCINSDLELYKIQELFPESYIDHKEITIGSRIVIVKANRGILSMIKLARLQKLMRHCDFPIGLGKEFVNFLRNEGLKQENRFDNFLMGIVDADTVKYGENNKILLRIEQNLI